MVRREVLLPIFQLLDERRQIRVLVERFDVFLFYLIRIPPGRSRFRFGYFQGYAAITDALDAGLVKFRSNVLDLAFTPRPRSLVEQPRRLPETALDRHKLRVDGRLGGARLAARLGGGDRRVQRIAASVGRRARRN